MRSVLPDRTVSTAARHGSLEAIQPTKVVTELTALAPYYPAEDYHQDYFTQHPGQGYCAFVVAPKVVKARQLFAARWQN